MLREKKAKRATLYGVGLFGQVWREEGQLVSHGTTDSIAANYLESYGPAPMVVFRSRGDRRDTLILRSDGNRYLLALAGWGHPVPPRRSPCKGDSNMADFDEMICEHVRANEVEVLARYGRPGPCASCGTIGVAGHQVRGVGLHPGYWICDGCYEAEFIGSRHHDGDFTIAVGDCQDLGIECRDEADSSYAYNDGDQDNYQESNEEHAKTTKKTEAVA